MGKKFENEIENLNIIYPSALNCDCEIIADYIKRYYSSPFLIIGSGGSYSVASTMEMFCTRIGIAAKCVTPLELSQYWYNLKQYAVVLFSAGGKNSDSINSYKYLLEMEPQGLLSICMCLDSKLKKIQAENAHNYFFEYKMPIHKDGYLAVESLVSSIVILSKAFYLVSKDSFFFQKKHSFFEKLATSDYVNVAKKGTIFVLYCGITKSIAIDLESKFGEASIGNVQLLDIRNFAHGRHFWLSDREKDTSIIVLGDKNYQRLIDNTLELLPKSIPILRYDLSDNSIDSILDGFEFVFEVVNSFSKYRGVDPGMPKIPEFGRKLYHISFSFNNNSILKSLKKDPILRGVYRKISLQSSSADLYYKYGQIFYKTIIEKEFKGIVFDYDGTLHLDGPSETTEDRIYDVLNLLLDRGISIGISTGRGKSVRQNLQLKIKREYWDRVVIAYYNGGCIGLLSDTSTPNKQICPMPIYLKNAIDEINALAVDSNIINNDDINSYQFTINGLQFLENRESIISVLSDYEDLSFFCSDHSIDVFPKKNNKNNIFNYFRQYNLDDSLFLRIGDSGNVDGNDFVLLNSINGISVDKCSTSLKTCWCFSEMGERNLSATLSLLQNIKIIENGSFQLGRNKQ